MSKIFIVEDEGSLRKALEIKCKKAGFEVKSATNGEDALKVFQKEDYDLIILDIVMPKMDGFTMLKELRAQPGKETIPVIGLSNLQNPLRIVETEGDKHFIYLTKADMDLAEIVDIITKILSTENKNIQAEKIQEIKDSFSH